MSGCYPYECKCVCHLPNNTFYQLTGSQKDCCKCNTSEYDSYPIVKKIQELEERIKYLESENKMRQDTISCIDRAYDEAFVQLEDRIIKLEENIQGVEKVLTHKCTNCGGSGAIHLDKSEENYKFYNVRMCTSDGKWFIWCNTCEGKGIVWE
jgi:hypothetical protein